MIINLIARPIQNINCSTLVAFSKSTSQKEKKAEVTLKDLHNKLHSSLEDKLITGAANEVTVFRELGYLGYRHVVIVGLGNSSEINPEKIRRAAAAAYDALKNLKVSEAALHFDGITTSMTQAPGFMKAFIEGLHLANYSFEELKSKKQDKPFAPNLHVICQNSKDKKLKDAFETATVLSQCVNFSRTLGDSPGNLMTPKILAEKTQQVFKGTSVKVHIWDKARIKKEKMGGLLGVSNGSDQEPRFIIMEYKGGKAGDKPLVFVGKGLTFDCGGISIKPGAAMEEMKYDMCGGANVIGSVLAIAKMKLKVNVIGLVPSTENLVNGSATKPGDVHTARNGKTFEVNNTDAEGRLILADALSYASELKPRAIVDAATLTGAIVVALGNTHTGYFTRSQDMDKKIKTASEVSGELTWRMPLTDDHVSDMKGTFADLSNISSGKGAGSATAAAFLEQFVGEGIPWAHFDIAGTAWAVGNRLNYCPKKGASGVMIRTFFELAKNFA